MFEDYLKKLESVISPNYYNKNNFREKIKTEFEDPEEIEDKNRRITTNAVDLLDKLNSEDDKRLVQAYFEKMGIRSPLEDNNLNNSNITSENKLKLYQKILDNEGRLESELKTFVSTEDRGSKNDIKSTSSKMNKTYSLSPSRKFRMSTNNVDSISLKEKIHLLNIKGMNYRHEVETLKNKITELTKTVEQQKIEIEKLEKQKETSNRYLLKLETLLSQQNINSQKLNFNNPISSKSNSTLNYQTNYNNTTLSNQFNPNSSGNFKNENLVVDFNKSNNLIIEDKINNTVMNFSDRNNLKEFIATMVTENQKLKSFQKQVFEISKNYDDINENMIEGIKKIQQITEKGEHNLYNQKDEITINFEKIIENIEKTLELKQNEYNFLLESKDQEIKLLQEEILKMNENIDVVKRDRIRDQKIINDFESEINFLSSRVLELNGKQNENLIVETSVNNKLDKKIAPARSSVNHIVKKLERTFDLQDKNNIKLLSNITKSIK